MPLHRGPQLPSYATASIGVTEGTSVLGAVIWRSNNHHSNRFAYYNYRAVYYSYRNSVCSSVCLSVTLMDCRCVHMVRPTIVISSPYGSPMILVLGDITFIPKFEGGRPRVRALNEDGVGKLGDFRPLSRGTAVSP